MVTLTAALTKAPHIHAMWADFLGQSELVIDSLSIKDWIDRRGYLHVKGDVTIKDFVYDMEMAFYVHPDPEELACVLVTKPREAWSFLDLFPDLPPFFDQAVNAVVDTSFLTDLGLRNDHLIVPSHPGANDEATERLLAIIEQLPLRNWGITDQVGEVVYGLNLFGEPSFTGVLAFINPFIEATPLQSLHGFLTREAGAEDLHLFFGLDLAKRIGDFSLAFEGFEIYTSTTRHIRSESGIVLYSKLQFGDNLEIDISGQIPIGGSLIQFDTYLPEGLSISSFTDLNALIDNQAVTDAFAEIVDLTQSIGLQSASLGVNIASPRLQFFEFQIGVPGEYPIIENIIHLGSPDGGNALTFYGRVDNPPPEEGERSYLLELSAAWMIDTARIDTVVSLPEGRLTGSLAPGAELSITSVLQQFFPSLEFGSALAIQDLQVTASKAGDYSLFLEVADLWTIDLELAELTMQSLLLSIDGDRGTGAAGFIQGVFEIGEEESGSDPVSFFVRAAIPEPGGGWVFSGGTGAGSEIPVGEFIARLATKFGVRGDVPEAIEDFVIRNVAVSFDTGTKHFHFTCEGALPIEGQQLLARLTIDLEHTTDSDGQKQYERHITGEIEIAGQFFTLHFGQEARAKRFLGVYSSPTGLELPLHELIGVLIPGAADSLPELSIALNQIVFSYQKIGTESKFVFWVDLDAGMDFSNLPLVGPLLPAEAAISVESLQIIYAKGDWQAAEFAALAAVETSYALQFPTTAIKTGPNLRGNLQLGDEPLVFDFGMGTGNNTPPPGETLPAGNATPAAPARVPAPADSGKWFTVDKKLGPLAVARVGLNFSESRLWFMLDAQVTLGPLSLLLQGLSFGSTLDRFDPRFNLRGFGLSYRNGPVEVSGIFLRLSQAPGQSPLPGVTDQFAGVAMIKTEQLSISAIGEYAMVNGAPSFYLYAYLGYPIGGPAFFFVEGLAVGFGFNRSVRIPPIEQVAIHPLVLVATEGTSDPLLLAQALISGNFIPIDPGSVFLAVGVRFTTFKLLDSFALLIVTFGNSFRLDILGISRLVVPPAEAGKAIDPLAQVTLALKGSFVPDEGFLGVQAQLTRDSYILSRDCVLQGGFAFFTWFDPSPRAGDFVLTVGGYHKKYRVPAHYPRVPRLGFHWRITPQLNLTGRMYFALTPSAVMAGGRLEAVWKSGGIKAWFIIGADFIISWKPYYYDARLYLSMGISVTFWFFGQVTISLSVGVALHIWGPEFSGVAKIDLAIVTFTVRFGANEEPGAKPIDWAAFKEAFIPETTQSMAVAKGLLKESDDGDTWTIDPKFFELTTDSVIPLKRTNHGDSPNQNVGIAPMDKGARELTTDGAIKIEKNGADISDEFFITPIYKAVPKALWGTVFEPGLSSKNQLVENVLTGFRVVPKPPPDPDRMSWFDVQSQEFNIDLNPGQYDWAPQPVYQSEDVTEETERNASVHDDLFAAYGFAAEELAELGIDTQFTKASGAYADLDLAIAREDLLIGELA
jgi:hypothetical protein